MQLPPPRYRRSTQDNEQHAAAGAPSGAGAAAAGPPPARVSPATLEELADKEGFRESLRRVRFELEDLRMLLGEQRATCSMG